MSNVPILDASSATRKIDVFQRTEGPDTVETQAVAVVNPTTGDPLLPAADGSLPVSGAFWQATQPVSAVSLPLPTGAATEATVATLAAAAGTHDGIATDGRGGMVVLVRRRDSDAEPMVDDGDLTFLNIDEEGRLKVASKPASYPDITGSITAVQATIGTPVAGGTVAGDVSRASNIMAFCTGTFSTDVTTFWRELATRTALPSFSTTYISRPSRRMAVAALAATQSDRDTCTPRLSGKGSTAAPTGPGRYIRSSTVTTRK